MWSFFQKDGSKDSLYDIEKKITNFDNESLFILFKGKIKSNGKNVSIFKFDSSFSNQSDKVANAKASIKRLKTLRHPSIISIIDSNESNDIFFVTEYVIPLKVYLDENLSSYTKEQKYYTSSYGLCQGNWKIGSLDYVTESLSDLWPTKLFQSLERYDPPEKQQRNKQLNEKWTRDSYGLGCLIYEIFNGSFSTSQHLEKPKAIPSELNSIYLKLINANPTSRLKFEEFIFKFREDKESIRNIFVDTMFFLDEIQIKDQNEKTRFFAELNENIDHFPPKICKKKILPKILESLELNIDTAILLDVMFKIAKTVSSDKYKNEIVPVIVKLFTYKDRITRSKLLQNVDNYIENLNSKIVNEIYLNIQQGFLDSNPTIREQTVKSMLHFAPKLSSENLNDNLLKNFSKLQVRDEEVSIRTNATVCLSKIACYLKPEIRQKVIVMAFLRCLRDPFFPARLAALNGLRTTQMFYPLQTIATQVMPALCHLTIDQEKKVRDESFKLLKEFLDKVNRVSENPQAIDEIESELEVNYNNTNKFTNNIVSSWSSWAVSSFTSKLISNKAGQKSPIDSSNSSSTNSSVINERVTESNNEQSKVLSSNKSMNAKTSNLMKLNSDKLKPQQQPVNNSEESDDGWEIDNKNSLNDSLSKSAKNVDKKSGWEEEIIDIMNEKIDLNKEKKIDNSPWNNNSNNKTTAITKSTTRPIKAINKTTVNKNKTLEDELFESLSEPTTRKKRGGGAMKLGAKKC